MPTKVAVYTIKNNGNSLHARHIADGAAKVDGAQVEVLPCEKYKGEVDHDVAIFWGYITELQQVMANYRKAGKAAVFIDSGYWGRDSHLKVSVNSRHPVEYFQKKKHPEDRFKRFMIKARAEWNKDGYILVAGMGPKAAWSYGLPVEKWEREAMMELRRHTDREIVYRPKPSQHYGTKEAYAGIPGVRMDITTPPTFALQQAYACVTHHSNVGVDGIAQGCPVYTEDGLALAMGHSELSKINEPRYPTRDEQVQFLYDVAYCQWSTKEMKDGSCWRYLKDEGLVP